VRKSARQPKLIDDQIDREIREANNKATDIW
jgi:hypothetical protein